MLVDLVLSWAEGFMYALVNLFPLVCPPGAGCEGGETVFYGMANLAGPFTTVMQFFHFANHWLPVDVFLVCLGAWFLALGIMAGIRLIWRLIPTLG